MTSAGQRTKYAGRMTSPAQSKDVVTWLLDSDPALRWQVERDIVRAPESVWQATRARVAREGFGAQLLALQDADGQWAGGAYFPRDFDFEGPEAADGAGQPYTATTWSLNALREWGVDAAALTDTAQRLEANSRWEYENLPYWDGEVDCCINAFTLANGLWLGVNVEANAQWFVDHQMSEGGWNCEWESGSTRSSFHSTLASLKGLLAHERATGGNEATRTARRAGEDYLLERRLMYRLSTGEVVGSWVAQFTSPSRWRYNVLTAVDYFREAALHDGTPPDPRLAEAIAEIKGQQQPDGTWLQGRRHVGRVWFEVDVEEGKPSKWLTLSATRVLTWWDASHAKE